ncbi:DUF192 domain-containing protein [Naumannella halotolerans]|uniref:DUF192 domain-containing protein n=1 Tax=Naumannella halotolerans TaxID=993414 RepID=UPI001AAEF73A|nr:DUF192 domain-containing protein [Naumannella halotolerans]
MESIDRREHVLTKERWFGPGDRRLICDGRVVAPVVLADSYRLRRKGLLGTAGVTGAIWLTPCASVHMVGMRYPIDVAVVDADGMVLKRATLRPWTGLTWPARGARATVEAAAGSMSEWGIEVGSRLSVG